MQAEDDSIFRGTFHHGKKEGYQRIVAPVQKPGRQSMMLGKCEPIPLTSGYVLQILTCTSPEDRIKVVFVSLSAPKVVLGTADRWNQLKGRRAMPAEYPLTPWFSKMPSAQMLNKLTEALNLI